MELQSIQEKLNTLLEGSERRIVFWYDEDAAYSEDIEALNINAKTVRLTGNNNFAVKLLLEHQDEENNYLVYAPFKRPEDKENFLADIFYYSKHFYSDKLTQLVNVELSSFKRRITGIEVRLDFMQMEPVSDVVKPRRLQAFFVDENNNKISFTVPITADISSKNPGDRLIQEKFTLKSGRYKRSSEYFLVLSDIEDESLEISRYKFEIDISGDKFRV